MQFIPYHGHFLGKSTAAKCALALVGQHNVGYFMKTKGISDSICAERISNSSLPFVLDDPKSPEDIGELLIQLYDGGLSGNMQKGLRKPRSIPLLCCNFTVKSLQRY